MRRNLKRIPDVSKTIVALFAADQHGRVLLAEQRAAGPVYVDTPQSSHHRSFVGSDQLEPSPVAFGNGSRPHAPDDGSGAVGSNAPEDRAAADRGDPRRVVGKTSVAVDVDRDRGVAGHTAVIDHVVRRAGLQARDRPGETRVGVARVGEHIILEQRMSGGRVAEAGNVARNAEPGRRRRPVPIDQVHRRIDRSGQIVPGHVKGIPHVAQPEVRVGPGHQHRRDLLIVERPVDPLHIHTPMLHRRSPSRTDQHHCHGQRGGKHRSLDTRHRLVSSHTRTK